MPATPIPRGSDENLQPFSPVIAPRMRMLERTHCRFCMKRIPDDALPPRPARDKAVQVRGPHALRAR